MREADLDVTVPAHADHLTQLRGLIRTFGRHSGAGERRVDDMVLALNEACGNVIVHAYSDEGPLHVRAWREPGSLLFEVSDNGTPVAKPVPGPGGGRGLPLIRQLSDDVDIEGPGQYGTRLEIRFNL